jgi:hypothetical protein
VTTIAAAPRAYTFQSPARLGFHSEFTSPCPGFCTDNHRDSGASEHPVDVSHSMSGGTLDLLVAAPGEQAQECTVMEAFLTVHPYALDPAQRVPHAVATVLDSSETPPLDPDAFAEVIDRFAAQVDRMREMHALLVEAVAAHQGGER